MWQQQQQNWAYVIEKLPIEKLAHSKWSEHNERTVVTFLETTAGQQKPEWNGLKKCWMPLPSTALLFPEFRYLL